MKILFVSENYYPQTSGVPVVVKYLSEGLAGKGHHVAVATQRYNNPLKEEKLNGVHIFRFDIYKNFFKNPGGKTKEFIHFILNYKADVTILECTQCITTDLLLPCLDKIGGRLFLHVHGISGLTPNRRLFAVKSDLKHTIGNTYNQIRGLYYFNYTLKKALPFFNATMCLSKIDDGIDYLEEYSRNNYILDNAADNMFFESSMYNREVLSKYTHIENEHFMMSCANYTVIKNQLSMIRQYYQSDASKNISLVCVGSQRNDYYQECQNLVSELEERYGHRDVKLLHGVERKDIPAIINKASLYLVSSTWEQYSISIIEAMSQGVPFISTNVGNSRLLPGGMTINNIDEMHSAIDALISDKVKYNKFSEAGRKFAYENCRIDVAVEKLEKIIKEN